MSQIQVRAIRPAADPVRPAVTAVSLMLLTAVVAVVLFVALRSPLKDDIAWLLYVARRWLDGRELYVDVVEVNPPLIIWLSAIPIRLADWLNTSSQITVIPYFIAIVLGCAFWTASLLRPMGGLFSNRLLVFAVLGIVLLVVPAAELGQREHLLVAAVLPYLVLFARSLDGEKPRAAPAIAAGVLAGLGCALKPRYGAMFPVLECLALAFGLRPWRALPLAACTALVGYVGMVAVLCPAYMHRAVPLALALYGATDVSFVHMLAVCARVMLCLAAAFLLYWSRRRVMAERSLMLTLLVFAATSIAICVVDGKDWFYHRLPATIVVILALALGVASILYRRSVLPWRRLLWPLAIAGIAGLVLSVALVQRLTPDVALAVEPRDSTIARLERVVRAQHARSYVAFSEWIALGFPVVNATGVTWSSRFDSMWALKGELWRARFDPTAAKEWPVSRWVVHDFITGCPDLAVVDVRTGENWVGILSATNPTFARAWSQYRLIDAFDGLAVYRRTTPGCITPWVASAGSPGTEVTAGKAGDVAGSRHGL